MQRDAFLNRIAARLSRERVTTAPPQPTRGVPEFYRQSPFGDDFGSVDRVLRFQSEMDAIGGKVEITDNAAEAGRALARLLVQLAPERIVTWDRREFAGWDIEWLWDQNGAVHLSLDYVSSSGDASADADALRSLAQSADVGVTLADYGVANTGTLALSTTPRRARSVSLLPTTHIVLLQASQIVDRIGLALDDLSARDFAAMPSSVHYISGPSRSADIENDLSIGVHGPAALYVIVRRA